MQDTLSGALVAARIRIQHHRFPSFESFSGRITLLYVLNKGPDAPDFGEALFVSHPLSVDSTGAYHIFKFFRFVILKRHRSCYTWCGRCHQK